MRILVCLLAACAVAWPAHVDATMPDMSTFLTWAGSLSTTVKTFAQNDLGTNAIQELYANFSYAQIEQNGTAVFTELLRDMDAKMATRVAALEALRDTMRGAYTDGIGSTGSSAYLRCCDFVGGEYSSNFFTNIGTYSNCVRFPATVPSGVNDDVRASSTLIDTQRTNAQGSASLRWQYFGSQRGLFRMYPSSRSDGCGTYDPRFRPWYVLAATPKPKDIVIVIDSSGSMLWNDRMSAAKEAARVVIDTLNPNDYVNVVDFDSVTNTVVSPACFSSTMARATPRNRNTLSDFVTATVASGGTRYIQALEAAYGLLTSSKAQGQTAGGDRAILFLTDGDPNDQNPSQIITYIEDQYAADPSVKVLTYGFGDGLSSDAITRLQQMAAATGGVSEVVPDGGDLRTSLGSYYDFFASPDPEQARSHAPHRLPKPVFTAPYWDASGLGLVVTAALPVFQGTTLQGVVGVDLTLTDLVSQVQYFQAGEFSYSFVTDAVGRTLTHPLLPAPDEGSADAIIVDISQLEASSDFDTNVRTPMLAGATGQHTLTLRRALPRGDTASEGVFVKELPFTVWYGPVLNADLRIGVALAHADLQLLQLNQSFTSAEATASALYHRLDLQSPVLCSQAGVAATKSGATYKLAPSAFVDPSVYLDVPETASTVTQWNNWVKGLQLQPPIQLLHASLLRSDVIASNAIGSFWSAAPTASVVWRYIGTTHGTFRMFPGAIMKRQYDPTLRPWFSRALANKGKLALSTPYLDAGGAGLVVTLSSAIFEGPAPHSDDDPVAAVAGMDFVLGRVWSMVASNSACTDALFDATGASIKCFLMDQSGYIIVHPNFFSADFPTDRMSDYFVGELYPELAAKLVDAGNPILNQQRCNEWSEIQTNLFYTSSTRRIDAVSGTLLGCGAEYAISTVQGTNAYIVAVAERPCVLTGSCTCGLAKYPFPATSSCQCPGPSDLAFDTCANTFEVGTSGVTSDPACPAPPVQRQLQVDDQLLSAASLPVCEAVTCADKGFMACIQEVGCNFCEFSDTGEALDPSLWYCHDSVCPSPASGRIGGTNSAPAATVSGTLLLAAVASLTAKLLFA